MTTKYNQNQLQKRVERIYRQSAKLNLYVQNIRSLDTARVAAKLENISIQITELLQQINPNSSQGDCVSQET
jgi:hypothetical protein